MALQYVEAQRQARPDLADWYASLADHYQRRLWHQLTLKLDQFLQLQPAQVRPPAPRLVGMVLPMGSQMCCFVRWISRRPRLTALRFGIVMIFANFGGIGWVLLSIFFANFGGIGRGLVTLM
jgi:hypothetical protein